MLLCLEILVSMEIYNVNRHYNPFFLCWRKGYVSSINTRQFWDPKLTFVRHSPGFAWLNHYCEFRCKCRSLYLGVSRKESIIISWMLIMGGAEAGTCVFDNNLLKIMWWTRPYLCNEEESTIWETTTMLYDCYLTA